MKTLQIDALNTGLIVVSFLLAYYLPFELFIFAYAILGPLHYFTEINWIRDKNYFVNTKSWVYIVICTALLLSIPTLVRLLNTEYLESNRFLKYLAYDVSFYLNSLIFIAIVYAIAHISFKKRKSQYIIIGIGFLLAILLLYIPTYHVIIGVFLPTIIHVYVFTILFMWYGHLKSKSKIGTLNLILMVSVPLVICFLSIDRNNYILSTTIKDIYASNNLYLLNTNIAKLLGLSDGETFFFYNTIDLKVQMFIAFAYTYHYLNWFSKTTIIGWHKKLTQKKSILILFFWIMAVGLYLFDYKIGLALLLFLSFLHVFMEFPLNIISIKAIGKSFLNNK